MEAVGEATVVEKEGERKACPWREISSQTVRNLKKKLREILWLNRKERGKLALREKSHHKQ